MPLSFGNSSALWLLVLLPALFFILNFGLKLRSERLAQFMDLAIFKKLVPGSDAPMTLVRALLLSAFGCFLIAALRPQGAGTPDTAEVKGLNLAFALDVSRSMLANDVAPSRLEQAKRLIHDVLDFTPGARVSLVVFSGTAFVEVPLTSDRNALETVLRDAGPDLVPIPGTRLLPALERSIQTLGLHEDLVQGNPAAAIVLISDGENFKEDISSATKRLRALRVPVFTLGVGTPEGAPVPTKDGFKRDKKGEVVLTKLNEAGLQDLAKQSRGQYFQLRGGFAATAALTKSINELASLTNSQKLRTYSRNELYQWPLLLGLLAFIFAKRRYKPTVLALLICCGIFLPSAATAEDLLEKGNQLLEGGDIKGAENVLDQGLEADPDNAALLIARGNMFYRKEDFQSALHDYEHAAHTAPEASKLQLRALYNAGNALAQLEKYEAAANRYEEALKIDRDDKEVASNLEYVKRKQNQPQQNQQQDQKQNQQQDQQQQQQQDQQQQQNQQQPEPQSAEQKEQEKERSKEETQALLGNLEEKRLQMLKHRYQKALEDLEKHDQQVPSEDW